MSHQTQVSDSFPQRKRTAHHPKDSPKAKISSPTQSLQELDILKQFDLTLEYGPCIGISRMERWIRAKKHGLEPSEMVKDIIIRHSNEESFTQSLWNDYTILK